MTELDWIHTGKNNSKQTKQNKKEKKVTEYSPSSTHYFKSQPIVKEDNQKKNYACAYG